MKQTSIHIPISDRDYPRAPRTFTSRSSDDVQQSASSDQYEDDSQELVEPLSGEEKTRAVDRLRSDVRSEFNRSTTAELLSTFGVQSIWSQYSDFEIHVRATELIDKFNREGIDYPSFWNSLV